MSCLRTLLLTLMVTGASAAADDAPPFVAGFDRFGRHAQIEPATAGRLLLSELSCTACHRTSDPLLAAKSGPRLNGVADRLNPAWLRQFLDSAQTTKPGTTMPDVLIGVTDQERSMTIEALLAFLRTLHQPWPAIKASGANPVLHRFWERGDAEQGRRLYHTVGCVACHAPDPNYETVETKPTPLDEMLAQLDAEEIAEMGLAASVRPVNPIPHPDLPAKYSRQSLTYFLLEPESIRPGGRMPSLKLKAVEAADIAAWLMRDGQQPFTPAESADAGLVETGRRLFAELGCANCHVAGVEAVATAPPLAVLDATGARSCIEKPAAGVPHYPLDAAQREAIQSALTSASAGSDVSDTLPLRLLQLNCYGCHERDEQGGVGRNLRPYFETAGNVDIGDEGRLPPPLTGVGRKLETAWLKKVLAGKEDVRPYMLARMPQFPGNAVGPLADLLATIDRDTEAPARPLTIPRGRNGAAGSSAADESFVEEGRALMDVGCVQCHQFAGEALPGVMGIDLVGVPDRVRPGWFHEFLLDPGELKPRTRMPSFFPAGRSQNPQILGGNPDRQIAAMWAYLAGGDAVALPEKIEEVRRQDFELKPSGRPLILRTFMPQAGTHAIAVGLPAGVHYAFDAEHLRLSTLWKGRFLDAQGTWFSRFAPPAEPLAEQVITLPPGPSLEWLSDARQPWPAAGESSRGNRFRGYRLDPDGVPTFLYDIGAVSVEDRIVAGSRGELVRRLVVSRRDGVPMPESQLWLRASIGTRLKITGRSSINQDGLNVSLDTAATGEVWTADKRAEWRVPLNVGSDPVTVEVRYQW